MRPARPVPGRLFTAAGLPVMDFGNFAAKLIEKRNPSLRPPSARTVQTSADRTEQEEKKRRTVEGLPTGLPRQKPPQGDNFDRVEKAEYGQSFGSKAFFRSLFRKEPPAEPAHEPWHGEEARDRNANGVADEGRE